jgi:hypothetical protein
MKQVLFLLLFTFTFTSVAQSVAIDSEGIIKVALSKGLSEVYVLYENRIITMDIATFLSKDTVFNDNGIVMKGLLGISSLSENYFLSPSGGSVFLMKNQALVKIDNSYEHQMQTEAGLFIYKEHIYKYGGYGLWSDRNLITRFDFETNEWELVDFSNSKTVPRGRRQSIVKVIGDDLYVIGGTMTNKLNPLINENSDEVWKFDLANSAWKKLGEVNHSSDKLITYQIIDFDDNILINNIHDDLLHVIDIANNRIKSYNKTSFTRKLNSTVLPEIKMFFYKDRFYGFFKEDASLDKMTLVRRNRDEIFGKFISEETFYAKETMLGTIIPPVVLVSLLIPLGIAVKKRKVYKNRLVLKKGQLYFNNKKIIVEPLKLAILSHLMDSEEQVYSKEIIELINKPHLDYSHSTRIMNDVLYKINYIVRTLLKTDQDIIRVSKSTFDKRLKVYSIDKGLIVKA